MRAEDLIQVCEQNGVDIDGLRKYDARKYDELTNAIHDWQKIINDGYEQDILHTTKFFINYKKHLIRIGTIVFDNHDILKPRFSLDSIQTLIGIVHFTNHPEEYSPIIDFLLKTDMKAYSYACIMGFIEMMMSRYYFYDELNARFRNVFSNFLTMYGVEDMYQNETYKAFRNKYYSIKPHVIHKINEDLLNGYTLEYAMEKAKFNTNTELEELVDEYREY